MNKTMNTTMNTMKKLLVLSTIVLLPLMGTANSAEKFSMRKLQMFTTNGKVIDFFTKAELPIVEDELDWVVESSDVITPSNIQPFIKIESPVDEDLDILKSKE